jgi:predicted regulator of Ras-like GTPase activity (Roadblock/LC7/MglB family)
MTSHTLTAGAVALILGVLFAVGAPAADSTAFHSTDSIETQQADIPTNVTVEPAVQFDENNFTFTADASNVTEDTDIQTMLVNFTEASGIETDEITEPQVTVTADGIGDPGVDSVQQNNPGELIITPQNTFTLDGVTGDIVVTIDGVVVPADGELVAEIEFQDDSNVAAGLGMDNYSVSSLSQNLSFGDQFLDSGTVTVDSVQSSGVESAVVVTYAEGDSLVVAGLTVGTFDNESVAVTVADGSGLQGEHTAHIIPTGGLSQAYQPGDTVSPQTAGNVFDQENATVGIDITDNGNASTDTTGDGLLNDVDGDSEFDIFDVQALFNNLETPDVQANPALFGFAGLDGDRVSIFDVQGLFNGVQSPAT